MRNMKLRLISAALATCMMASVLPASAVTAFADDVEDNTSVTTPAEDPMGTLLEKPENENYINITTPGTYQMKGEYVAPVRVLTAGTVIINITDDVNYVGDSYAIRVDNDGGTLIVNNDGHTFRIKGGDAGNRGILRVYRHTPVTKAVVNGGIYEANGVDKEMFFNHFGDLTLNNITADGSILVKNYGGTALVKGGKFTYTKNANTMDATAIVNKTGGTLKLVDVDAYAADGSCVLNIGGTIEVEGGTFTTDDEENAAIQSEVWIDNDGNPSWTADITTVINGATIKDSNRAIAVKNGKFVLKDVTLKDNANDIYLGKNYNDEQRTFEDAIDMSQYKGAPLTLTVTDTDGNTTLDAVKPADLTVEGGTVKVDTSSLDKEATVNKDGDTTKASVPVKALVTVTYDEAAYKDSNLKFSGWTITGLANAEDYKNQQTFAFEMPANNVTIKAGTATADTDDDSWDAATVVTGVAIGAGAAVLTYHIGTELYAKQVLGDGVAVPKTREEVALKAWELAGKPAVELNGEPLSEAAQAEKWAVESGLMHSDAEGNFNGAKKMNKLKALRVLDKAQKLG